MTSPLAALALTALAALPQPPAQRTLLPLVQVQSADVASQMRAYVAFCQGTAKPEYVVDCLAERFNLAADTMGNYGATADLYRALKRAARDLAAVSRKYAAPATPPLVLSSNFTTTRPIRPVAPANLPRSNAAATEVLQEAELTLLRSATRSPDILAFQQVAEILGSAKVLLRSG